MRPTSILTTGVILMACVAAAQPPAPPHVTAAPTDWIYVVDTSLTMLGRGKADGKNIFAGVKQVIDTLLTRNVRVGDTVRLISFDRQAIVGDQVFIGSEAAKEAVRRRIEQLDARGRHTHIAQALQQTMRAVTGQVARDGRSITVVMFTDGIDEPPPGAGTLDLQDALDGLLKSDAAFHFINLGTAGPANDLDRAMKIRGLDATIHQHPDGISLPDVDIPREPPPAAPAPPPTPLPASAPLLLTVVPLQAEPIRPDERIDWTPFEVSTTRPVDAIRVDAHAPRGVIVEPIPPLRAGDRRPRVRLTAPREYTDRDVEVRFVLRPAGQNGAAVEVTSRLHVTAPPLLARVPLFVWPPIAALLLLGGGTIGYRWWFTPPLEGTLLTRAGAKSDAINLRTANASRVVIGRAGRFLSETSGFQLDLSATGSRRRVDRITATLREGAGTLNKIPLRIGESRTLLHDDRFELVGSASPAGGSGSSGGAGRVVVTYQNFRIQGPSRA